MCEQEKNIIIYDKFNHCFSTSTITFVEKRRPRQQSRVRPTKDPTVPLNKLLRGAQYVTFRAIVENEGQAHAHKLDSKFKLLAGNTKSVHIEERKKASRQHCSTNQALTPLS